MKNYMQPGRSVYVAAPTGGVTSGNGVLVGNIFGVAGVDAAAGETFALHLVGVYVLNKVSAQAWSVGDLIYWDQQLKIATTTSTSAHPKIGVATKAAANPSSTGEVRLNGAF